MLRARQENTRVPKLLSCPEILDLGGSERNSEKNFRLSDARFDERDGDDEGSRSGTGSDDSSDPESDYDEFQVSIRPVDPAPAQFNPIPDEERSTHFVAIKITDPDIVRNAIKVQQHIAGQEEVNTVELQ